MTDLSPDAYNAARMTKTAYYQRVLSDELSRRVEKNPRYSLRALAKAIGTDAGSLSRILAGTKVPTVPLSQKIFHTLHMSPEEQQQFLSSVAESYRALGYKRLSPKLRTIFSEDRPNARARELSLDAFRVISDWYHYAILELTFVRGFKSEPAWIAKQLGISVMEAKLAIERLLGLELLQEKNGKLTKSDAQLSSADKQLTTAAHKKRQKQVLEKSIESLENDPIEERVHSAITMAIDPKDVPIARKRITEFCDELCASLERGERKKVYEMQVSLFPIQRGEK